MGGVELIKLPGDSYLKLNEVVFCLQGPFKQKLACMLTRADLSTDSSKRGRPPYIKLALAEKNNV